MMTLTQFLAGVTDACSANDRPSLIVPLQAVATAVFDQLVRVERERITHLSHPIRVLKHVCLGLRDQPATPPVELALGLAAICHDASTVKKKALALVARIQDPTRQAEEEYSRRSLRLLHEAEGVVELVKAVIVANQALRSAGNPPIGADSLEIAARVCAVHDGPSLRSRLSLAPGTAAGEALAVFVLADGLAMIEHDGGLTSPIPIGPTVELWAREEVIDQSSVGVQMKSSLKSLKSRLQAAFGLPKNTGLSGCFASNPTLADLAVLYARRWADDLAIDLEI